MSAPSFARTSAGVTDAQLQALVSVAESGSFTMAARRLGLTQSAISHAVTSLEQQLRVALVERTPQGARLTPVGERIVAHANEVLRLKAQIFEDAEGARRLQHGRIRIGSFGVSASRRFLPPLLDAYAARHPGIALHVVEGTDDEVERWLADGTVDVAFVNLPNDAFDTIEVAQDVLHAIVPARGPLAARPTVDARELASHPFILSVGGCEKMMDDATGNATFDVRYRIREVETILAMVGSGMGVTLIPRLALPDVPPADVAFVPLATEHVRRVGLAVRKQEDRASPARALLKLASREGETPRRL